MTETPSKQKNQEPRRALDQIIFLLRQFSGNDFDAYKKTTLRRRIDRRKEVLQIDRLQNYADYLEATPQELALLFSELLIGVTSFFRDPEQWAALMDKALPRLLSIYPSGRSLRAWVTACSTGEEAYSLAIAFAEAIRLKKPAEHYSLQIFATDLSPDSIAVARKAIYPPEIASSLTPERLSRYFVPHPDGYQVCREIRNMVVFAPQNLIADPPFSKIDLLTCRNLFIYLEPATQQLLLQMFHYSLNPDGILMLGHSERITSDLKLFSELDSHTQIFNRLTKNSRHRYIPPLIKPADSESTTPPALPNPGFVDPQSMVNDLLLKRHTPAAVLANLEGDITYIHGSTGKYLEPPAGKANWNLYVMARDELRYALANAIKKLSEGSDIVVLDKLSFKHGNTTHVVKITVEKVKWPRSIEPMMFVVFSDTGTMSNSKSLPSSIKGQEMLKQELQHVQEQLTLAQHHILESREDLQCAREELQANNEELQSTNEELMSSKEELISLNEDLAFKNSELLQKVHTLMEVQDVMNNMLNSTEQATIFLDRNFNVRRFNPCATNVFKLLPIDSGRPLADINCRLDYPQMQADLIKVLETLQVNTREVLTHDGYWFIARITPFLTSGGLVDGVVLSFTDVTRQKNRDVVLSMPEKNIQWSSETGSNEIN
jgi:chemotaxis methyl-accepting protein methylase